MRILRNPMKCPQLLCARRFSSKKPFQEVSIPVPWGEIRGKWWGSTHIRPILAIHGWQDNCGSYDRLIPLLNTNVGFLAIDMPGHGYSSRLPPGLFYHYTNYILTIKFIKEYLGWPKLSLIGHSMGGVTSYTYTTMYPQEVDFLVSIDGLKPKVTKDHVAFISKCIEISFKNNKFLVLKDNDEPPSYTLEEIKQKLHEPNCKSIDLECTQYIMERGIVASKLHPGKYYFVRDPRIKSTELNLIPQSALLESAPNITCPVFVAKAKLSLYYEPKEYFYQVVDVLKRSSRDFNFHYIEGTHHTHLNTPDELAALLRKFIEKHNVDDRTIGGLKQEMIVAEEHDSNARLKL